MLNIFWRALADKADFAWDAAHAGMDDLMWFTIEVAPEPNNYFIFCVACGDVHSLVCFHANQTTTSPHMMNSIGAHLIDIRIGNNITGPTST